MLKGVKKLQTQIHLDQRVIQLKIQIQQIIQIQILNKNIYIHIYTQQHTTNKNAKIF